jgi:hypothetical protein
MSDEEYSDTYEQISRDDASRSSSGSDSDSDSSRDSARRLMPPNRSGAPRSVSPVTAGVQPTWGLSVGQPPPEGSGDAGRRFLQTMFGVNAAAPADAPAAEISGVAKMYRHDCQNKSCPPRWSAFATLEDEDKDLKKRIADQPILHRHTKKAGKWVTQHFTIQCSTMRTIVEEVLEATFQDVDQIVEDWTFQPPYRELVHSWDALKEACAGLTDEKKKAAAKTLIDFLTPVLAVSVELLSMTRKTGKVEFENVWQIFPPGALAVTSLYGVETLCRVMRYQKMLLPEDFYWLITLEYVDWNGEKCGYGTTSKSIMRFTGLKQVRSLSVYALDFDDTAEEKKAEMLKRGRRFESLRGYHFLTCKENGRKIVIDDDDGAKQKAVSILISSTFHYLPSAIFGTFRLAILSLDYRVYFQSCYLYSTF